MPKSKKPRKRRAHSWQPDHPFAPTQDQWREAAIASHVALDALLAGQGQDSHWQRLGMRVNTGSMLAKIQSSDDGGEAINNGIDALASVKQRHDKTGRYGCSGAEAQAIKAALDCADQLFDGSTWFQIRKAIRAVYMAHGRKSAREGLVFH